MIRIVTYCFLALFALASCNNSVREVAIVAEDIAEEVFYLEDEIKPFTGVCNIINPYNGNISQKLNFEKGILSGEAVAFYKDGSIRRKGTFKDGMLDGAWEFFDEKGNKTMVVNYVKDNLNGEYTTWFCNGQIKEKGIYKENSKTGTWVTYNESGQMVTKSQHSDS